MRLSPTDLVAKLLAEQHSTDAFVEILQALADDFGPLIMRILLERLTHYLNNRKPTRPKR